MQYKEFSYTGIGSAKIYFFVLADVANLKNKIEWYIITAVKEMRVAKNLGQEDIAIHLNLSTGFIGQIESPNHRAKYNVSHLNELAKLFNCSPRDFLPERPI